MARIATYVILDLETTNIPRQEHNKTKITELSMVVVKRKHILETRPGDLPRVQHKLTMCFNPGRLIHPGATEVSGLDNDLLEYETMFNMNVFNTINSFLECQEKPVCLIAENGLMFDFPILKNHFEKLKVSLAEDVMCADSLNGFYDILKISDVNRSVANVQEEIPNGKCETVELQIDTSLNGTVKNCVINDELEISNLSQQSEDVEAVNVVNDSKLPSALAMQLQNERTPTTRPNKPKITPKRLKDVKRKIFFGSDQKPKESFKLKQIYERIMGRPGIDAHRAENDCVMTAEILTAKAEQFVEWVDHNHCPFSEVKAMRLGVPLGE